MMILKLILLTVLVLCVAGVALGIWVHSRDLMAMQSVWTTLEKSHDVNPKKYDPAMSADLPEVARRYFARAITPGTALHRTVRLTMDGTFILNGTELPMKARQILTPPSKGFVWQAEVGSGMMRFAGSDGYLASETGGVTSWTRFWLHGLIPLARIGDNPDHARAAATRVLLETVWAPATLLPQFGARWIQTGSDSAEIRFSQVTNIEPLHITFDTQGNPTEVWALRWTDANAEKVYRLQPFGGRILETKRFNGFLIPSRVEMGNMYGTSEYAPFFLAQITLAAF
jgi:hypothetical protein